MSADPYALLLENLAAGAQPGGAEMQGLLAQLGETDPRVGLIARYFEQQRAAEAAAADEEAKDDEEENEPQRARSKRSAERREAVRSLQRLARSMYEELEVLRERNDTLAAALGACYLCWGEDFECEVCGGAGAPGTLPPDWALFSTLVAPAARRLRQLRGGASQTAPIPHRAAPGRATNPNEKPN